MWLITPLSIPNFPHPHFASISHPNIKQRGTEREKELEPYLLPEEEEEEAEEAEEAVSMAATSISATGLCCSSSFIGGWGSSVAREDYALLAARPGAVQVGGGKAVRFRPMMKNVNEGKGVFAPLVVVTRNIIGKKRFNQFRGKAIALHSQVLVIHCFSH